MSRENWEDDEDFVKYVEVRTPEGELVPLTPETGFEDEILGVATGGLSARLGDEPRVEDGWGMTRMRNSRPLDTQVVELLGRLRLTGELLRDGLEVAVPMRDRGVDLIAYADLSRQVARFAARPIQMKAFTASGFSVAKKYRRIANLIVAYVWHLGDGQPAVTYAMPYAEAVELAETMGWTNTPSWKKGNAYSCTRPSKGLVELLERHRMGKGNWWALVVGGKKT